jgi:Ca2+-transporting ATPase
MVVRSAAQPFVLLLLAAGVGAAFVGELRDGLLILAGLIPLVAADVATEYRGERALEALRAASAPRARVRRDGRVSDLPACEVVPGDIVLLRVGDVVPADIRMARAERLILDRSVLTGESVPEATVVDSDPVASALADRRSMAYAGTSVVGGRGEGIVVATGHETEVGRIASGLSTTERRRSPLQLELARLVRIMLAVAIALIAITVSLGALRGNSLGQNLLAGITAAIAAIPEEPPVLLAVVLGLGAYRLLRRDVLVRRINAEEVLGAIDLIITDKTGTLTQNRLAVSSVSDLAGPVADPVRRLDLLTDALRAEEDAWEQGRGIPTSSFTRALIESIASGGGRDELEPAELVSAAPPTDSRPYSSTTARRNGHVETLVIGAPEAVADLAIDPDDPGRETWHARIDALTSSGQRVVGLARRVEGNDAVMLGLIGFADPVRDGVAEAVTAARDAGIQVVVVTGDHPTTALAIGSQVGLGSGRVTTGPEVEGWSDGDLIDRLPGLSIVARSTPETKERIVRMARGADRVVAVTGDGVNDAPALHAADVAVAMGSGTAVAREASDLVLGDDSFATLVYGIQEGRRIVDNVQKGLVFLVSTHVALLGFILIATVAGFSQALLPIQVLWLELFIDLSASVSFEREPSEPDVMHRPPRPSSTPLLTAALLGRIVVAGAFSAIGALWLMLESGGGDGHARWLAYCALVCAQAVRAYSNRSLMVPLARLGPNLFLLTACLITIAVQFSIPYIPPLAEPFVATPLGLAEWALVAVVAVAPSVTAEVARRRGRGPWVA